MKKYLDRLLDRTIEESLKEAGCVVIEGPKWSGKSTSAKRLAKTIVELQWPAVYKKYKIYSDTGDPALLEGETPLMFDEWQMIPDLWDYIRAEVDRRGGRGHFIITGSAKPKDNPLRHSGIGRMKSLVMRPMSLWESEDSNGAVSIKELFGNPNARASGTAKQSLADIAFILCRGGWPEAVTESDKAVALKLAANYVDRLVQTDIVEIDGIKRNEARAKAILRAYARIISSSAPLTNIVKDIELKEFVSDPRTLEKYVNAYRKLYVIEDVEAWSPALRSKATLRRADTRQFVDPSIAAAALNASPQDLVNDLNTFGLLFESLVIRDLRIYAERVDGDVFNYRDSLGLEADAVIHLHNGKWAAIEVKLGGQEAIEQGAKHLLRLKERVDKNAPEFLLVITATGFSYRREDGVYVVPIGCLKD
ncbi:ATPase AAA [Clostridia bacterium]|nr:ATPase AAA [Clostridia bacterium]